MASIQLDDLHLRYPGAADDTLRGISLNVAEGEAHALLGASGSGKTTLLNLLSGLLFPTRGRILLADQEVTTRRGRERRVSQVFQFPVLYESLDVAGNLAFPLKLSGFPASQIQQRIGEMAEELGLCEILPRRPAQLSLFEKQLVAVAKALIRPDLSLVLLDEPLTAVEPKIKWRLRQTLRKAQQDLGVTMIYVTHDQTEALTFADRVSLLNNGEIVQTDTPTGLYQRPINTFVGHFVGSPGMNFVPSSVVVGAIGDTLGFRAEWCELVDSGGELPGRVKHTRFEATEDDQARGVTTVATPYGDLHCRGSMSYAVGEHVELKLRQHLSYANDRLVDESGAALA